MAEDARSGPDGSGNAVREMLLDVAHQRQASALARVEALQRAHPEADSDELTKRLIRDCARDLAIGGAVTGGAAASPVAGPAATAAMFGTEGVAGVSRLGEMVMAIGIVNGHHDTDADERALWVATALGVGEGAAMGMTGLAARAGARGGARLAARIPTAAAATAAGAGRTKRLAAKMGAKRGPWGLAALLPYTIGAGVGAAGNAALAASVGRAARRYFAANPSDTGETGPPPPPPGDPDAASEDPDEIWDAEVIEERIVED